MQATSSRSSLVFDSVALVLIFVLVHALYAGYIRPQANAVMAMQAEAMRANPDYAPERSFVVIAKDYEQEACFVFTLWALLAMGRKGVQANRERALVGKDLIGLREGMRVLPEDSREYLRHLDQLPAEARQSLLPRALYAALERFGATRSVSDASIAARNVCQMEADRMDTELSMTRFVAWAIPAIGFVGTVRGIGESLQQAHKAVEGDVSGVTAGLGVAFNSTLIALALSIVVMFVLHQLQLMQERTVLDTESYIDERLLRHLHVR
jgi:biopolymer transport protein ExbB/TolQ